MMSTTMTTTRWALSIAILLVVGCENVLTDLLSVLVDPVASRLHPCCIEGAGGCDDRDVESIACGLDEFCCTSDWDHICVALAQFKGGIDCDIRDPCAVLGWYGDDEGVCDEECLQRDPDCDGLPVDPPPIDFSCSPGFVLVRADTCCPEDRPLLGSDGRCYPNTVLPTPDSFTASGDVPTVRTWSIGDEVLGPSTRTLSMHIEGGDDPRLELYYFKRWYSVSQSAPTFTMFPYANTSAICEATRFIVNTAVVDIVLSCSGVTEATELTSFPYSATITITGQWQSNGLDIDVVDQQFFTGLGNAQWEGAGVLLLDN